MILLGGIGEKSEKKKKFVTTSLTADKRKSYHWMFVMQRSRTSRTALFMNLLNGLAVCHSKDIRCVSTLRFG